MDENEKKQFEEIEDGIKAEERLKEIGKRAEDIATHIPYVSFIFEEAMKCDLPQSVASDMALDYWRTEAFYRPYIPMLDGDDEL
jgi:hypothetical protein